MGADLVGPALRAGMDLAVLVLPACPAVMVASRAVRARVRMVLTPLQRLRVRPALPLMAFRA
ncbi:hypothetical protein [Catenulispora sp. GP43]|uniref:hypothetical protein n=1 Tax=Catenulispora sp. GP43 TaxID=3156263 RepID=UPI003515D8B9